MDPLAERLARLSPTQLAQFIQRLQEQGGEPARSAGMPRRAGTGPCPLSFAQQRLWFIQQLDPQGTAYNEVWAARLDGALDALALQHALDTVVARHEALRTVFVLVDGEPAQQVVDGMRVELDTLRRRTRRTRRCSGAHARSRRARSISPRGPC